MQIDIDSLLLAISETQSCGEDLSFSNAFHEIKKAKTQDDLLLDQGDWVSEPKQADWSFVNVKSTELLAASTKDIRLLTWLTEAWSHLYGLEGIASGINLSHQMLGQFWDEIHPVIDDGDLDQRLGLLQGLINQFPTLIKQVPVTSGPNGYSLLDYENFLYQQNNRLKHADEAENASPLLEMEQFEQEINNTPKSRLVQNYQYFNEIQEHWQQIKQVLNQILELDAPSFAQVDSHLENIHKNIKKIYKTDTFAVIDSQSSPTSEIKVAQIATTEDHSSSNIPHPRQDFSLQPQNHLHNREQAMQVLQEISDYFEKNEPHSPVSYMLKKTIKWNQLPLHEWLAQVIKNENPLESIQELLGVQAKSNESNDW